MKKNLISFSLFVVSGFGKGLQFFNSKHIVLMRARFAVSIFLLLGCFLGIGVNDFRTFKSNMLKMEKMEKTDISNMSNISLKIVTKRVANIRVENASNILRELIAHAPTVTLVLAKKWVTLQRYSVVMVLSYTTVKLMKVFFKKKRPDMSDDDSFPSGHAMQSGLSSVYIHINYGFWFAVPLYILSAVILLGRVFIGKHDVFDVFFGFYIGAMMSLYAYSALLQLFVFIKLFVNNLIKKLEKLCQSKTS
ncbi:MAG: phosphatase PAP2 family protein [Alphaproteobacteria bacterium]|nr:phosphatase PAP2 family protein [Rickettsiales bacterium]